MTSTLTIRLSARERVELERAAREEGLKLSDIVRMAVRRTLAQRDFRRMQALVEPYARAKGILTDEDVFKLIS